MGRCLLSSNFLEDLRASKTSIQGKCRVTPFNWIIQQLFSFNSTQADVVHHIIMHPWQPHRSRNILDNDSTRIRTVVDHTRAIAVPGTRRFRKGMTVEAESPPLNGTMSE